MNITIDKNLREFRGKRGNTQEDLAEHLSISPQAVSRWERGETMPDITFLPAIASFYDVTVDELLGVGEIRKKEKTEEYCKEYNKLMHEGYSRKAVELARKACGEFPNDLGFIYLLCHALQAAQPTQEEEQEVIALCDRILSESTDSDLRALTTQTKCMAYANLGDKENGRKCAMSAQGVWQSCNALLPMFLEGKELTDCSQSNILDFTDLISTQIQRLAFDEPDPERRLKLTESMLKLFDLIFDDGNYGYFVYGVFRFHLGIAWCYADMQNEEQTRLHLEAMEKYVIESVKIEAEDKCSFTSTILKGYEFDMTVLHKPSTKSDFEYVIAGLHSKTFDRYRECEWFNALIERLKAADENLKTA